MKSAVPALLFILLLVMPAPASQSYYNGYTSYDHGKTWTYYEGDWWYDGGAYYRTKRYTGEYEYDYGRKIALYVYDYYPKKTGDAPVEKVPPYKPGWKEELAKVAALRDDHLAYQAALNELGFKGQVYNPLGTSYAGNYRAPANFVPQGQTQLGYSYQTQNERIQYGGFSAVDLAALFQMSNLRAESAQASSTLANTQLNTNIATLTEGQVRLTDGQLRLLESQQKYKAAMEFMRAMEPQPRTIERTTEQGVRPMPKIEDPSPQPKKTADERFNDVMNTVIGPSCTKCHLGKDAKAGLDFNQPLTDDQREAIIARTHSKDPKFRMPPDKPLAPEQKAKIRKAL